MLFTRFYRFLSFVKEEREIQKLIAEMDEAKLENLSKQHQARIKTMKKELDKEFDELRKQLRAQQRENITKITEEHESRLVEILRDFRVNVST